MKIENKILQSQKKEQVHEGEHSNCINSNNYLITCNAACPNASYS